VKKFLADIARGQGCSCHMVTSAAIKLNVGSQDLTKVLFR
jgi:hypothetical protein